MSTPPFNISPPSNHPRNITPKFPFSSPPSPNHPPINQSRRSSISTTQGQQQSNPQQQPHRRSRSFRDPHQQHHPNQNHRSATDLSQQPFMMTKDSTDNQKLKLIGKRQKFRPPPLQNVVSSSFLQGSSPLSSSSSSVSTSTTTFFNTSTESSKSPGNHLQHQRCSSSGTSTPSSSSKSRQSTYSITSEYSTTSSSQQTKQSSAARIAAAGGKLAYLASRRGSSGSVGSVGSNSTPPNTPGGAKGAYERFSSGVSSGTSRRRQSSGNFLEVPFGGTTPLNPPTDPFQNPPRNNPTTTTSPSSRPRVNSLPATSLFPKRHVLSPTTLFPGQQEEDEDEGHFQYHHHNHTSPYNPRSTITKSQDHLYRLRTFNITKGGDVVNCGDTFVRKSKSNNCIVMGTSDSSSAQQQQPASTSVSPRKCSLSTSPTRSSQSRTSPSHQARRGSLSPRLVLNYQPFIEAAAGCCALKQGASDRGSSSGGDYWDESDDGMSDGGDEGQGHYSERRGEEQSNTSDEELTTMRELVIGGRGDDEYVEEEEEEEEESVVLTRYRVVLLGESGVGKSALVRQFMTSEYINTYDMSLDEEYGEREVSVLLDSKESQLVFIDHPCVEMSAENSLATYEPHAAIVVYSVTDKRSFEFAGEVLRYLWQEGTTQERSVILVGNKCDLARVRVISSQEGKQLATSYESKFIETSSGIQHNVDELLVGVLKQIRLREEANNNEYYDDCEHHHYDQEDDGRKAKKKKKRKKKKKGKERRFGGGSTPRGSIMNLLFTRELINKLCFLSNKAKSCENLHVL